MDNLLIDFSSLVSQGAINSRTTSSFKPFKKVSRKGDKNKISSFDIINSLSLRFTNHKYIINNAYVFPGWESDFLSVSEAGYVYEMEIKVSKSDFKDDFNKTEKHILLESKDSDPDKNKTRPNKFFYAVPKGLLQTHLIPAYAGLIEISHRDESAVVIKEAPFIHQEKLIEVRQSSLKDVLCDKFYWRLRDLQARHFIDQIVEFEK